MMLCLAQRLVCQFRCNKVVAWLFDGAGSYKILMLFTEERETKRGKGEGCSPTASVLEPSERKGTQSQWKMGFCFYHFRVVFLQRSNPTVLTCKLLSVVYNRKIITSTLSY